MSLEILTPSVQRLVDDHAAAVDRLAPTVEELQLVTAIRGLDARQRRALDWLLADVTRLDRLILRRAQRPQLLPFLSLQEQCTWPDDSIPTMGDEGSDAP